MEICQKDVLKIVGITVATHWENLHVEMPKAWQELFARHAEIKNRLDDNYIDVGMDNEGDTYIQVVGVEVNSFDSIPAGMTAVEIPAQKYIYHRHIGPVTEIANTFGAMYDWGKQNGLATDEFKLDVGYMPDGQEREHGLFIRVMS